MAGLCPRCGNAHCQHKAMQRGQSEQEYQEDLIREPTQEEKKALASGKVIDRITAASQVFLLRKRGIFTPNIPNKSG